MRTTRRETPMERAALEAENLDIAKKLRELMPDDRGFALFTFDFGPNGFVAYASTGSRDDMLVAVGKWFLREMEQRPPEDPIHLRLAQETLGDGKP